MNKIFDDKKTKEGIFIFSKNKDKILKEIVQRVLFEKASNSKQLDEVISDTAYNEIERLKKYRHKTKSEKKAFSYWKKVNKILLNNLDGEKIKTLENIANFYVKDIMGNFNPKVYVFTTKLIPLLLSILFRSISRKSRVIPPPEKKDVDKIVFLKGQIKEIQNLSKLGTIILVPTHVSNMDSIVVGWALFRIGLSPFTYGAGKNLFTNPVLSYFMNNLGAYKVDRRLKHNLYKDILKIYSTVILEKNHNSLFFPGGTRSRSGEIEKKLKLGLIGTGIKAYINNLKANKEKPNIYIVPCNINYHLVLEAETLIDDYLKETGKAQYIIENDEFSSIFKVFRFITKMAKLNTHLCINFASPLDLFGNKVNSLGQSCDSHGRIIDTKKYVMSDGIIKDDEQRDIEYTKELGEKITQEYMKNNIALSTNIVAFCLFEYIQKVNPNIDIYHLMHLSSSEAIIDIKIAHSLISKLKERILQLSNEGKISIENKLRNQSEVEILREALNNFNMYYKKDIVIEKDNNLILNNIKLLYYYHNRLIAYDLEKYLFF